MSTLSQVVDSQEIWERDRINLQQKSDHPDDRRGGNRTDAWHFGDLLAQRRLLHERLDRSFDEVNPVLNRTRAGRDSQLPTLAD